MIDVFDIMDYVYTDGVKYSPIWNDRYFARLILWLKTPGGSVEDGFVCYRNIIVSGPEFVIVPFGFIAFYFHRFPYKPKSPIVKVGMISWKNKIEISFASYRKFKPRIFKWKQQYYR